MNVISKSIPTLHVETRDAKVNIKQKRPKMVVKHQRPRMIVSKKAPRFKVNRSVINVRKYTVDSVRISRRFLRQQMPVDASRFAQKLAEDNITANVEYEDFDEEMTLTEELDDLLMDDIRDGSAPLETISLEWEKGAMEIEWTDDILEIMWDIDPSPEINVEPHDIKIYVRYHNDVTVISTKAKGKLTGVKVDKRV